MKDMLLNTKSFGNNCSVWHFEEIQIIKFNASKAVFLFLTYNKQL